MRISCFMRIINLFLFGLILAFCFYPLDAIAAEVLQVRSSSLLQIGDNNRSYTVQLVCMEVDPTNESAAKRWIKQELPRGKRVNLKPKGSKEGVLLAKVTPIGSDKELGEALVEKGLGRSTC